MASSQSRISSERHLQISRQSDHQGLRERSEAVLLCFSFPLSEKTIHAAEDLGATV
jgi:hypothetical protein